MNGDDVTLWGLIAQADPVVKGVMLILAAASIWSWAVAIDKLMQFGELDSSSRRYERAVSSAISIEELDDRASERPKDAMGRVFAALAREWREARRTGAGSDMALSLLQERAERLMQAQITREVSLAARGLGVLASIGSTAPFIGLFGTVWGIMNAFVSIDREQQASLAVVAPGIAEALLATAMGLIAAVPAVIFFNKFNGDLDRFAERLESFAEEALAKLSRRIGETR